MQRTTHKTIWSIAACFFLAACAALLFRTELSPDGNVVHPQDIAMAERDKQVEKMEKLLETDWRIRRTPTRATVESVSRYAQHPVLQNAETFFALGLVRMYKLSDVDGAEQALQKAIEMDPRWSWSHNLLGVVLYTRGDKEAGLRSLNRAMELSPEWSRPHNDLAILYRQDGDWDKALEHAAEAIRIDPEHPIPYYNYGVILYMMGEREEAQAQFQHVLELNSDLPAPYYNIACGFAQSDDLERALEYLEIAIRLDPAFYEETLYDPDFDDVRSDSDFVSFMDLHHP
mgnify:CR=1 FL=1|jgi:Flp pilus assembly protein TadD